MAEEYKAVKEFDVTETPEGDIYEEGKSEEEDLPPNPRVNLLGKLMQVDSKQTAQERYKRDQLI